MNESLTEETSLKIDVFFNKKNSVQALFQMSDLIEIIKKRLSGEEFRDNVTLGFVEGYEYNSGHSEEMILSSKIGRASCRERV